MPHITPGTHIACATQAAVYENANGTLVLCLDLEVRADPPARLKGYQSLTTRDGAINTRCVESLRQCFPEWDGTDPFWFEDADLTGREVEIVVEDEVSDRDGKTYSKVAWINPPGGRGGGAMPASGNRAAILSKYGSRFRALAGGAPAAPKAAAPAPAEVPAEPAQVEDAGDDSPPAPPEDAAPAVDMAACWRAFCDASPHKERAALNKAWWNLLKEAVPGKQQGDFSPADWGRVLHTIRGAQLPF